MAEIEPLEWGVVPRPIFVVLDKLQERVSDAARGMSALDLRGEAPRQHDETFQRIARAANVADRVSSDYRSVFNAYVHRFHRPKPAIGDLARAQETVIQTFAKRYTAKTVAAVEALLSPDPDIFAIRDGIRSLGFDDLWRLSEPLDLALKKATEEPGFEPWLRHPR